MERQEKQNMPIMSLAGLATRRCRWADFTTLRCGLGQFWLIEPQTRLELQQALEECTRRGYTVRILGGGSNTIGSDQDCADPVIRLGDTGELAATCVESGGCVRAGAGVRLFHVLRQAVRAGLGGLAGLSGIPGTLGGAVSMNAGANGQTIATAVQALIGVHLRDGTLWHWPAGGGGWGYRRSPVPPGVLLTDVLLQLQPVSQDVEEASFQTERVRRSRVTPAGASAGSVFLNPSADFPAGRLLEACGCKGMRRGALEVSQAHANWIVNLSGEAAAAADGRALVEDMRRRVREHAGIELQCEWRWM